MGLLHAIGAIKSLKKNGVGGLLGQDIIDQEIVKNLPSDLSEYSHCQIDGVSYAFGKTTVSSKTVSGDFVDGARVLIVSPLGYRILAHVSEIKNDGGKLKMRIEGVHRSALTRLGWIAMIGDNIAEYNNLPDSAVVKSDRPVYIAASFSHYDISLFSGYAMDGIMIGADFTEGQEVTMFHDMSRVEATIKSIEPYDKEIDGVMQHWAKIKISLIAGELSGDLTKADSRITIVPRV